MTIGKYYRDEFVACSFAETCQRASSNGFIFCKKGKLHKHFDSICHIDCPLHLSIYNPCITEKEIKTKQAINKIGGK